MSNDLGTRDPKTGQFLLGHNGQNGAGRPKGSRNRLSEKFLHDLETDWEKNGAETIARVRQNDPSTYFRVTAGLLPAKTEATLNLDVDAILQAREFVTNFRAARRFIGADEPAMIDITPEDSDEQS
jgi:hypothetical protein